jgi:hypothetical protein
MTEKQGEKIITLLSILIGITIAGILLQGRL